MAADTFRFFASHVQVELRCEHGPTLAAMRAVWGGCVRPLLATTQRVELEVTPEGDGYAIHGPRGTCACSDPRDVLPLLEAVLYTAMHDWHAGLLALHAACVTGPQNTWVLLGRSGSGKSSLARAAVRRGLQYFSDEIVLCDGQRLWGIPRAIQFAPLADGTEAPAWLGDADLHSYRFLVNDDGREGALPLWRPAQSALAAAPVPLEGVRVYALERSAVPTIDRLPALELLGELHEAAYRPPAFDLGRLVHPGRCGRLRWRDPDEAVDRLLRPDE